MNLRSNCLPSLTKAIEILALRCLGTAPHSCPQWLKRASGVFEQEKDAAKNMIDEIVCMVQNVNNTSSLSDSFIRVVKCRSGKKMRKRKTPCDFHGLSLLERIKKSCARCPPFKRIKNTLTILTQFKSSQMALQQCHRKIRKHVENCKNICLEFRII